MTVEGVAAALREAGEAGRRVAVIGAARNVGTTLTTIALARTLSRGARVVMVDLAFVSPNLDVISNDPAAAGITDLVRGAASFGDIITKDAASNAHVVAAGRAGPEAQSLMASHMLAAALDALAQSYDYLIIDAGSQSDIALAPVVRLAPRALLVAGEAAAESAVSQLRDQMLSIGFADVTVMTGFPPPLEQPAAGVAA
jgi:Mrp family chromosome partitioning ATPase